MSQLMDRLNFLTLRMRYDDGFVAYLNGTEIARRNAPDSASSKLTLWTSRSTVDP